MAAVAGINGLHQNNLMNVEVELNMDRSFQFAIAPADLAILQQVGPILKFHLCINRSYRQSMIFHGVSWTHTTTPTTMLNHYTEFPVAHARPYLDELFSLVGTLIPPELLPDTVSRIFAFVIESSANTTAAVVQLDVELTLVRPLLRRSASVQVVDSVMIVDDEPPQTVYPWAVDSVMIVDDEPEVPPVEIPRRPARRSARDLKERYLLGASEANDNLGDCAVCLEELKIMAGDFSGSEVLKVPCSHMFHHRCISKWLKMRDNCPICRAVIP